VGELAARGDIGIADGRVFLMMFVPSVVSLFLVTLPFASEKPVAIDHPLSYLALFAAIFAGYLWRLIDLAQSLLVPWPPQRGVGFWLAAVGLVLFSRGVFEVFEERSRRLY
jgi:hypothetical protein